MLYWAGIKLLSTYDLMNNEDDRRRYDEEHVKLITLTRAPYSGVSGTGTTNEKTQSFTTGPGDSIDT